MHLSTEVEQWGSVPERSGRGRCSVGRVVGGSRPRNLRSAWNQFQCRYYTSKEENPTLHCVNDFCESENITMGLKYS